VRSWPTQERSGLILFWHSPLGRPPQWDPPHLAEHGQAAWGDYFLRRGFRVRVTAFEIIENIADTVHGVYVHGGLQLPDVTFRMEPRIMHAELHTDLPSVGGKQVNSVTCHGLGLVENRASGHAEKAFFSANTPVDRDHVQVWFSMLAKRGSAVSEHSARATVAEFEKDIPIWEAKMFRATPLLVKDDGPILKFRLWAEQFFPAA
jgi:phenylpropionate dioxygenase-like ring-hydroxylating dioxygenase large terminal subunit